MKFSLSDENRHLRLKLVEEQEKYNKEKTNLTDKIIDLENKISDLEFLNTEQSINIKTLEEELLNAVSNKRPESSSTRCSDSSRRSGQTCYALHTSSISGINDYISLLAKAKEDVVNYKKESSSLRNQLEQCKQDLLTKCNALEKLKYELEYERHLGSSSRKVCVCHEADSCYESDSKSERRSYSRQSSKLPKIRHSKSSCRDCCCATEEASVSNVGIQVNTLEDLLKSRLDEYIRNAKDCVSCDTVDENRVLKSLEDERDYYCREYHRLKDKVLLTFRNPDRHPSSECPYKMLDNMRSKLNWQREEIEELKKSCNSHRETRKQSSNHCVEDCLKQFERRESELSSINDKLANKARKLEDQCDEYRERIRTLTKENSQQKSVYSQLKMMQDDSERSLFNTHDALRKCDSELNCALSKIRQLETDNKQLKRDISIIENEKKCLKKNLIQLDHEKDNISLKLDEKTELAVRLEKECSEKKKLISQMEHKVNKLEESLKILQNINMKTEETARHAKKSYSSMQQDIISLQSAKEALTAENHRLQDNLSSAVRDCFQCNNELQAARAEVEQLKVRLQSYVSEVRRIEDILQIKEDERRCMLEQLKGLNVEYSSYNSKRTSDHSENVHFDSSMRDRFADFGNDILGER